jgi:hypothetical protein
MTEPPKEHATLSWLFRGLDPRRRMSFWRGPEIRTNMETGETAVSGEWTEYPVRGHGG